MQEQDVDSEEILQRQFNLALLEEIQTKQANDDQEGDDLADDIGEDDIGEVDIGEVDIEQDEDRTWDGGINSVFLPKSDWGKIRLSRYVISIITRVKAEADNYEPWQFIKLANCWLAVSIYMFLRKHSLDELINVILDNSLIQTQLVLGRNNVDILDLLDLPRWNSASRKWSVYLRERGRGRNACRWAASRGLWRGCRMASTRAKRGRRRTTRGGGVFEVFWRISLSPRQDL